MLLQTFPNNPTFLVLKMCGKEIKNYKKIMALHFKVSINNASRVVL